MTQNKLLNQYATAPGIWDEMHDGTNVREVYGKIVTALQELDVTSLQQKERLASELFMNQGITFTVYSDNAGIERIFPFDILPRLISAPDWRKLETGIQQRLKALNLFLKDVYN